jgi:hypothetical protein
LPPYAQYYPQLHALQKFMKREVLEPIKEESMPPPPPYSKGPSEEKGGGPMSHSAPAITRAAEISEEKSEPTPPWPYRSPPKGSGPSEEKGDAPPPSPSPQSAPLKPLPPMPSFLPSASPLHIKSVHSYKGAQTVPKARLITRDMFERALEKARRSVSPVPTSSHASMCIGMEMFCLAF